MTGSDDLMRPAERALGVEPGDGPETEAEAQARADWEQRLVPLALALPAVEPPSGLWRRIEREIDAAVEAEALLIDLDAARTARDRWRRIGIGCGALAAGLAGLLVLTNLAPAPLPPDTPPMVAQAPAATRYLAVVTAAGGPSIVVELDLARGTATLRPVGVQVPPDRTLELWRIAPGAAPVSHGLIAADQVTRASLPAAPGDTIAITLEPPGGAPGGIPSGPPILSGPVVALPE